MLLSKSNVLPTSAAGATVGTFSVTDLNLYDTYIYTLVPGEGDTHNSLFTISGNSLRTNALLFEGSSYSVRVNVNDGSFNFTKVFTITCQKEYPVVSSKDNNYDYITYVKLKDIEQTSEKDDGGYGDYTTVSTTLNQNETYTLSVANGADMDVTYPQIIKAWFDWNDNKKFDDEGEEFLVKDNLAEVCTTDVSIKVPSSAVTASIRMRVAVGGTATVGSPVSPLYEGIMDFGEAEDYTINIEGPLPVELTEFSAAADSGKVKLFWKTATEVNNYGFEVERTAPLNLPQGKTSETPLPLGKGLGDGQWKGLGDGQWEKIGFVPGNGNSNSPKEYSFVDDITKTSEVFKNLRGLTYGNIQYRLKQIDTDGSFSYYSRTAQINLNLTGISQKLAPSVFALEQNFPNPFNPITCIKYVVSNAQFVSLKVYDILGNEVSVLVNEYKAPGYYQVNFNAASLASGVYIYKFTAGNFTSVKKLTLMK